MKIAILILAAGTSSRMKTSKQLLKIGNTTLIQRTIKYAMKSNASEVFCVLGAHAEEIQGKTNFDTVQVIINEDWQEGLSSSIVVGVKNLKLKKNDAVLIMLADQPYVDVLYLNALIDEFKSTSNYIIASKYGERFGVPALFPEEYFGKLLKLQGDKGANELLNSENIRVKTIVLKGNLFDVDTPEDYEKL